MDLARCGCSGRILDKSLAGSTNGYMLDTYPANGLRLITSNGWCSFTGKLPANKWVHVVAVYSPRNGSRSSTSMGKRLPHPVKETKHFPPMTVTGAPVPSGPTQNGGSRFG